MIIECILNGWTPRIGDPHLLGWVTTAGYLLASLLCLRVFLQSENLFASQKLAKQRIFWLSLSAILLILCVNKQLDIQVLITVTGRCVARAEGWYEDRQVVQYWFILAVFALALIGAISLTWLMWDVLRANLLALVGTMLILVFVAVRSVSFHHVDVLFGGTYLGVRASWIIELTGIACVIVAAVLRPLHRTRLGQL